MATDRILVTAATGNVGAPLVKALQRMELNFQAATRDAGRAREQLGESLDTVYLDFEEPSSFGPALEGNNLLFLCGPSATTNAGELLMPMVEEAEKHGIVHVTLISSYPKVAEAIRESGVDYCFINANFFMQNFELYQTEDIRDRHQIFLPCGKGKASFIHTRDIGEVAAETLSEPAKYRGQTLSLTGPKALSMFEAASIFSDGLGTEITYQNPSDDAYRREMETRGYSDDYIDAMINVFSQIKEGTAAETRSTVEKIFGHKPLPLIKYVHENKVLFRR